MKVQIVVGTRPNFIKITQFPEVLKQHGIDFQIVHTGQHYDDRMATVFFKQFGFQPDVMLGVGQGSPTKQIGETILKLKDTINNYQPDLIITPGDVNSTLATSITANKMGVRLAHLESGLRSNDVTMPEEINRIIADELADLCLVTEQSGQANLLKAGKKESQIHFVGNTMIDTLVAFKNEIESSPVIEKLSLKRKKYVLLTMHRPSNVDGKEGIKQLTELLKRITQHYQVVFPIHPRTIKNATSFNLYEDLKSIKGVVLTDPLDYFSFQKLIKETACVVTDSGGIQEETTFLQVPCLTLRENTERPVTIDLGTNQLLSFDVAIVESELKKIKEGSSKEGTIPPLWDGKATERIVEIIKT